MPVVPTCTVSGVLVDAGGNPLVGSSVSATAIVPATLTGNVVTEPPVATVTDGTGSFSLTLARGASVRFYIPDAGYNGLLVVIPNQSSINFSQLTANPVILPPLSIVDVINVQAYGAKGDGVNDDSSAIQAALNAVSANGSVVYFPPGTYILHNSWLRIVHPNTHIVGAGMNLVLIKSTKTPPSSAPSDGLYGIVNGFGSAVSNCTIEGVELRGTVTPPSSTWFGFVNIGAAEKGFYFAAQVSPSDPTPQHYTNVRISRCRVSNTNNEAFYASGSQSGTLCDMVEWSDNEAVGCASNSWNFNAGPSAAVIGVKCLRNTQINVAGGIQIGGYRAEIEDNHITGPVASGATWILASATVNKIRSNIAQGANISNGGVGFIVIGNYGQVFNVSALIEGNIIDGNIVNADGEAGLIDIAYASGGPIRVANNMIVNNAGNSSDGHVEGISVQASVSASCEIEICDNYISSGQTVTNPQTDGITIKTGMASPNKIRVHDNTLLVANPLVYQVAPLSSKRNEAGALPVYANNAAAVAGGLPVGESYRTGSDPDVTCVVH